MKKYLVLIVLSFMVLQACASTSKAVLDSNNSQLQLRNYQARVFDTNDQNLVMRALLSTMQDLGFIITTADEKLGTVSGTSHSYRHLLSTMTVSVRKINDNQISVRLNIQVQNELVEEPIIYQNFFNSLSQSLFLEAHEIK